MKKGIFYLIAFFVLIACNETAPEKPANLIDENKMVDIIYDMSLLEAIKVTDVNSLKERGIDPKTYIYKKYKIDSAQLAQSDRYYALDVDVYAGIYEKITKRIEAAKNKADTLLKQSLDTTKIKANREEVKPVKAKLIQQGLDKKQIKVAD